VPRRALLQVLTRNGGPDAGLQHLHRIWAPGAINHWVAHYDQLLNDERFGMASAPQDAAETAMWLAERCKVWYNTMLAHLNAAAQAQLAAAAQQLTAAAQQEQAAVAAAQQGVAGPSGGAGGPAAGGGEGARARASVVASNAGGGEAAVDAEGPEGEAGAEEEEEGEEEEGEEEEEEGEEEEEEEEGEEEGEGDDGDEAADPASPEPAEPGVGGA
jgi:hypothetical protein